MNGIRTLVPGLDQALAAAPQAKRAWQSMASMGPLTLRQRALVGVVVAAFLGDDYARWVMSRLAIRQGLTEEDVFLATLGTALDGADRGLARLTLWMIGRHDAAPGEPEDAVLRGMQAAVAHAVMTCRLLESVAPRPVDTARHARKGA